MIFNILIQLQYIYITIPLTVQCTQLNIESILFVTAPVCECAANVFGKNLKQYKPMPNVLNLCIWQKSYTLMPKQIDVLNY